MGEAGGRQGGTESDDGKHSLKGLELQWESVSLLNRWVWGNWAGRVKDWWDFHTKRGYLLSYFLEENLACRCVGPQIDFSPFSSVFAGGSEPRSARACAAETQLSTI